MTKNKDVIELILARLNTMPDHIRIHLGKGDSVLDKEKLIEHVKKQDTIGKTFIKLQMAYIKASIGGFS